MKKFQLTLKSREIDELKKILPFELKIKKIYKKIHIVLTLYS